MTREDFDAMYKEAQEWAIRAKDPDTVLYRFGALVRDAAIEQERKAQTAGTKA